MTRLARLMSLDPVIFRSVHARILALLLIVVGAGAVIVLGGLGVVDELWFDSYVYHKIAVNLLDHFTFAMEASPPLFPTTWRAPGYPAFIALVYSLGSRETIAVGIAQFLLLVPIGYLVFVLARRLTSEAVAGAAALLVVVYPPVVLAAPWYSDEVVSTLLALAVVAVLIRLKDQTTPRTLHFILLGGLVGILTLVRPSFLLFPGFVVAGVLVDRWKAGTVRSLVMPLIAFTAACAVIVVPWIVRNSVMAGQFVNINATSGWGLMTSVQQYSGEISHRLLKHEWEFAVATFNRRAREVEESFSRSVAAGTETVDRYSLARKEAARDRQLRQDALTKLKDVSILRIVSRIPDRLFWLWSTADISLWRTGLFHRIQQILHVILALAVIVGLSASRTELFRHWLFFLVPVYLTFMHLIFPVEPRYTIQARPFLLIYAAIGLKCVVDVVLAKRTRVDVADARR